ncbi:MAG: hypothetical protein QG605_710 [Euryarchaeota archaeon]|nr:hypothetical protein [Euryarchaeota archaeon]
MSVQESNNYEKMSALLNDMISLTATMLVSLMDSFLPKWQVPKSISSYAGDGIRTRERLRDRALNP